MLINTGEEPHTHDIVNVSFIKNPIHKTYPLSNPFVKMKYFVKEIPDLKIIANFNV